jgi:hypothetical protein
MGFGERMQLHLRDELPFMTVLVGYQGKALEIEHVLVDTGSASTLFAADFLARIGVVPEPGDKLYAVRGVGGSEAVFSREIDFVEVGAKRLEQFEIEIGGMDYGFEINGILGMDFLLAVEAIINLKTIQLQW